MLPRELKNTTTSTKNLMSEIEAHICASFMAMSGMKNLSGLTNLDDNII
jgi:hypothetical protein